jgi:hypothetical protein
MHFDIEHNAFWWPAWGARPTALADAFAVAAARVSEAPRLIPVYRHRYLPAEPCAAGNPVLSVYQMDIIYYGADLREYLANEFEHGAMVIVPPGHDDVRRVPFWGDVVRWVNSPSGE